MPDGNYDPASDLGPVYDEAGKRYGLDPDFLRAQTNVESSGNPYAVSSAGAEGISQFIPSTASREGLRDPYDPREAIPAQAKLMRENADQFGSMPLAVAAYHGGTDPSAWGEKTRGYLDAVNAEYQRLKAQRQQAPPAPEPQQQAPGIADQIKTARQAGYSDDEIASYLQQSKTWAPKFDAARKAGYLDSDVFQHFGLKVQEGTPLTNKQAVQQLPAAQTDAQAPLPPQQRVAGAEPNTPPTAPPAKDTGWLGAVTAGLGSSIRGGAQTYQALAGGRPAASEPTVKAAEPIEWGDVSNPGLLGRKFLYGIAASAPQIAGFTAGAALGGGPETPIGLAAGAAGAAIADAATSLGPAFGNELKASPQDPEGAFNRAMKSTGVGAAFTGLGFASFGIAPFEGALKNMVFQAFGVQPAVAVAQKGTENYMEGRPVGEDVFQAVPGAIAMTAAPMLAHAGARRLMGHGQAPQEAAPAAETGQPTAAPTMGTPAPEAPVAQPRTMEQAALAELDPETEKAAEAHHADLAEIAKEEGVETQPWTKPGLRERQQYGPPAPPWEKPGLNELEKAGPPESYGPPTPPWQKPQLNELERAGPPPPPEGTTRLYRVGPTPEEAAKLRASSGVPGWLSEATQASGADAASGRWFTPDREEVEWYAREHPEAIRFVDVPNNEVQKYRALNDPNAAKFTSRPDKDFFLPTEISNRAETYGPPAPPWQKPGLTERERLGPPEAYGPPQPTVPTPNEQQEAPKVQGGVPPMTPLQERHAQVSAAEAERSQADEEARSDPKAAYDAANAAFRDNAPAFTKAQKDYRAGRIGDDEYLAARKTRDDLMARVDQAEAALPPEPEPHSTEQMQKWWDGLPTRERRLAGIGTADWADLPTRDADALWDIRDKWDAEDAETARRQRNLQLQPPPARPISETPPAEETNGLQEPIPHGDAGAGSQDVHGPVPGGPLEPAPSAEIPGGPRDAGQPTGPRAEAGERPPEEPGGVAPSGGSGPRDIDRVPEEPEPGEAGATGRPPAESKPDSQVAGTNHTIEPGSLEETRSPRLKASNNLDAISLAKQITEEGRPATKAEQDVLAKYVGWGGLPGMFEHPTTKAFGKGFEELGPRLKDVLTPDEHAAARASTQNAHYTAEHIVRAMWQAVQDMGFKGGNVFEPGMGVGHFLGLMPPDLAAKSHYEGIERDPASATIAKLLYPESGVREADYVKTPMPQDHFDLAIGNPPFSDVVIKADPKYSARNFMLHDYFFAKTMDSVRPGGLMGFVTSAGTMNKLDTAARDYLAERAEFLGGARLPSDAFKRNAGTEVTTDILFFRKMLPGEQPQHNHGWTSTVTRDLPNRKGAMVKGAVNSYFSEHPEQVLGEEGMFDKLAAGERYGVRPVPGRDLRSELPVALDSLPKNVMSEPPSPEAKAMLDFSSGQKKDGSYYVGPDGQLMQYRNGAGQAVAKRGAGVEGGMTAGDIDRIHHLIPLRDALRDVFRGDLARDDAVSNEARVRLGQHYDRFVSKFGPINKAEFQHRAPTIVQQESFRLQAREEARDRGELYDDGDFDPSPMLAKNAKIIEIAQARQRARDAAKARGRVFNEGSFDPDDIPHTIIERRPNIKPFMDDPESYRLRSIEDYNDATGQARKKAIFAQNILTHEQEPQLNSANDGVLWSLNKFGRLDLDAIAGKIGRDREGLITELGDSVYKVPGTGETYQTKDEYLSGDVVSKLAEARAAAEADPDVRRNIPALEAAQPPPLAPSEISMTIGMPWMPDAYLRQFADEHLQLGPMAISHNKVLGRWTISSDDARGAGTEEWSAGGLPAEKILDHAINRIPPKVYTPPDREGKREFDAVATQAAQDKVDALKAAFDNWVKGDEARHEELAGIYNNALNRYVLRQFDGSYLTTPGVSAEWHWRPHQTRVVARIVQAGNTYMAHAVGAGKTSAMIGSAMEMRRLGLVKKPMFVVPNHMLQQFTKEFYEQYPTARIAVADDQRFHTDRRRQFISNVAQDDLDGIVITHSSFGKVPISDEFQDHLIHEQLDQISEALSGLDKQNDRFTVKRLENQKEKLEQKLSKKKEGTDLTNTFEELGVDFLYVDEAHLFRKLQFATAQSGMKGIDPEGSDMAWDLYSKARYLDQQRPGRSLVLASGTPVTNTMGELYSLSRYLQPEELEKRGIGHFDSWAQMFGDTKTALEQDAAGGYKPTTRFSKFVNMPELYKMVGANMDIVTPAQLEQYVVRPKIAGGQRQLHMAPKTPFLEQYQADLAQRMKAIAGRKGPPQKGDDILLSVINDGRHSAIDPRFVAKAPNDPDAKLNMMIANVAKIYHEFKDTQFYDPRTNYKTPTDHGPAAQMIFANLGVNGRGPMGFSSYQWMKHALIRQGVDPREIAFIGDFKNHVARQALFNDMNQGKVRVLIGSTSKMGTGINAQRRLLALHNLDPLWYPADDEQRVGRILRQGNQNPEIQVHDYATKGTYDSQMWSMMGRKGRFIEQFFRGDPALRDMEDLGEASMYEQAAAMATSDERIIRLTEMKQDLDKAMRRSDAFNRQQYSLKNRLSLTNMSANGADDAMANIRQDIAQRQDTTGKNFKMTVGDQAFTDRKTAAEALSKLVNDTFPGMGKGKAVQVGDISGFPLLLQNVYDRPELRLKLNGKQRFRDINNPSGTAAGLIGSAESALRNFESDHAYWEKAKAGYEQQAAQIAPQLGKTFEGGPEIEQLQQSINALETELRGKPEEMQAGTAEPEPSEQFPESYSGDAFHYSFPGALFDPAAYRRAFGAGPPGAPHEVLSDKEGMAKAAAEIKAGFAPTSLRGAKPMEYQIRAHTSRSAQAHDIDVAALEKVRGAVDRLSQQEQIDFNHRMETGQAQPTPELQKVAVALRSMLDGWAQKIQGLGKGYLANAIENYMGHIWGNYREWSQGGGQPGRTQAQMQAGATAANVRKAPLRGSGNFLKQRSFPTQLEGINAGLVPVTYNPVDLQLIKAHEMRKFYHGTVLADAIKGQGIAHWVRDSDAREALSNGQVPLDDTIFQPKLYGVTPIGPVEPGKWYAPEPAARVFNNYMSQGWANRSTIYDALRMSNNALNGLQLGIGGFHAAFVTNDVATSKVALGIQQIARGELGRGGANLLFGAPVVGHAAALTDSLIKGGRVRREWLDPGSGSPETQRVVDAIKAGGFRLTMPDFFRSSTSGPFFKHWNDLKNPGSVWQQSMQMFRDAPTAYQKAVMTPIRIAARTLDTVMEPLMGALVPRAKAGVMYDLAADWLRRNPTATDQELSSAMTKFQDSVDNRLGQLNYDNLFWNKTMKDIAFITTRSVGWNLGTARELGGAFVDSGSALKAIASGRAPQVSTRMAYALAMPMVTGMLGSVLTYMATGQGPQSLLDYFYPPTGQDTDQGVQERRSIPGYMKDVFAFAHDPIQTVLNKTSPMLEAAQELGKNRDYYGGSIYDAQRDRGPAQAYGDWLINQATPFSLRSWGRLQGEGAPALDQSLGFFGFQPAPASITNPERGEKFQRKEATKAYKQREKEVSKGLQVHIFNRPTAMAP